MVLKNLLLFFRVEWKFVKNVNSEGDAIHNIFVIHEGNLLLRQKYASESNRNDKIRWNEYGKTNKTSEANEDSKLFWNLKF